MEDSITRLTVEEIEKRMEIISHTELDKIPSSVFPEVYSINYFFISYSHKDYIDVYRDIFYMQLNGLSIWYDRGIPAGKDWKEVAKRNINPYECKGIILYVSEYSLTSSAVIEEIEYVKEIAKPFIAITIPFSKDYLYKGENVKGKQLSILEMINVLLENDIITKKKHDKLTSLFNASTIFLALDTPIKTKVEKIKLSLPNSPLLNGRLEKEGNFNYLYISSINNRNVDKITRQDIYDLITHLGGNTDEKYRLIFERSSLANCEFLTGIYLSDGQRSKIDIYEIGEYAFANDIRFRGFYTYSFSRGVDIEIVANVCDGAFYNCSKLKTYVESFSKPIGSYAYYGCASLFDSISINSGCPGIGDYAFANCKSIKKINIDGDYNELSKIGEGAFFNCTGLRDINIEASSIEELSDDLFNNCVRLTKLVLPKTLKKLGTRSLCNCRSLESFELNSDITSIGDNSFFNCVKLSNLIEYKNIYYLGSENNKYLVAFRVIDKTKDFEEIHPECAFILDGLFENNRQIKGKFVIPDHIISVGSRAFKNAINLNEVVISKNMTSINEETFYGCKSLTNITLTDSIKSIDNRAFSHCVHLLTISFPEELSVLGEYAFEGCKSLNNITFPPSINNVSKGLFKDCVSLTNITLHENIVYIQEYAFYHCKSLSKIVLGAFIKFIYPHAFNKCSSLKTIHYWSYKDEWRKINNELFMFGEDTIIREAKNPMFRWWDDYEDTDYVYCINGVLFNPLKFSHLIPKDKRINFVVDGKNVTMMIAHQIKYKRKEYIIVRPYEEVECELLDWDDYIFEVVREPNGQTTYRHVTDIELKFEIEKAIDPSVCVPFRGS